ncbi:hypothetical protein CPC08DRAFT_715197 [Agrocybe pediades]|nr:hypothetical protein CPC08DRAFT_715197 [Agrocybe pediades]
MEAMSLCMGRTEEAGAVDSPSVQRDFVDVVTCHSMQVLVANYDNGSRAQHEQSISQFKLRKEIDELKAANRELRDASIRMAAANVRLAAGNKKLIAENESLTIDNEKLGEENEEQHVRIAQLDALVGILWSTVFEFDEESVKLNEETAKLKRENDDMKETNAAAQVEIDDLKKDVKELIETTFNPLMKRVVIDMSRKTVIKLAYEFLGLPTRHLPDWGTFIAEERFKTKDALLAVVPKETFVHLIPEMDLSLIYDDIETRRLANAVAHQATRKQLERMASSEPDMSVRRLWVRLAMFSTQ